MDMDMDNMDNHHKENLMNIVHEEDPAILIKRGQPLEGQTPPTTTLIEDKEGTNLIITNKIKKLTPTFPKRKLFQ